MKCCDVIRSHALMVNKGQIGKYNLWCIVRPLKFQGTLYLIIDKNMV